MGSLSPDPPKPWVETPLIFSPPLSRAAGCNIYLKLENTQPSGSFKSRGIGNMMLQALITPPSRPRSSSEVHSQPENPIRVKDDGLGEEDEDETVHFYCSSGGNAGLACATTAATLGCPATIVVPTSTSAFMTAKLRELGAEVVQTGASWAEADAYLRETLLVPWEEEEVAQGPEGVDAGATAGKGKGRGSGRVRKVYVPPFDHPDVWTGASTMVDEIARDWVQLEQTTSTATRRGRHQRGAASGTGGIDAIVCNVGGGGLLNGIMEGLERCGKRIAPAGGKNSTDKAGGGTKVLAVETEGADSLHASVRAGELVTLPGITSIATSLGARRVSAKTWEWARRAGGDRLISATVADREAAAACVRFLDDARILIEVACGATVATAYNGDLRRYLGAGLTDEEWATRNVVLVVCGGSNISLDILEKYKKTYGIE